MPAKILVVDDEVDVEALVRQIFRRKIRANEFLFIFAHNGIEALEMVASESPIDLVLTDINMPEMDGLTFIGKLQEIDQTLKPIIISAYGDMDNIRTAMSRGAIDFLTKPFNIDDLELTVNKSLQQIAQTRENLRLMQEKEVAKAESIAKSSFLASMSHEIRTPLNAIVGMSDILATTQLNQDQKKYVSILEAASEALLDLINDILDLSKIEAGKLELEQIPFNLPALIEKISGIMSIRCNEKNLQLQIIIDPEVPIWLNGDPARIRQILINLIGNAIKFTRQGGITIEVKTESRNEDIIQIKFSVLDTGDGIPEEKFTRIFEAFSQADSSISRKYGGTGLGLSICRRLVDLMQGKIWVNSQVGSGSTFYFTAQFSPAEPPEGEDAIQEQITTAAEDINTHITVGARRPAKILLVDDTEHNRTIIQFYLQNTGHRITDAENGEIALNLFKQNKYDLVFMDMQMPVMDGMTATREIRKWELEHELIPTPVIGLTAVAFTEELKATLAAGCNETITKPVKRNTILAIINKYARLDSDHPPQESTLSTAIDAENELVVHISNDMKEIVPYYFNDMKSQVSRYWQSLEQGDFNSIRMLGHQMKGSGGAYGFDPITTIGGKIEHAAEASNREEVEQLITELSQYLNAVKIIYD